MATCKDCGGSKKCKHRGQPAGKCPLRCDLVGGMCPTCRGTGKV